MDINEECAKDDVSQSKSEGNRTYCDVAPSTSTVTQDIAVAGLLSLLDGPIWEGQKRTIGIKNLYMDELELN